MIFFVYKFAEPLDGMGETGVYFMFFEKLRAASNVLIGTTKAIPERASVSFPIELQTDSRK